ncbi:major facilitator superfamily MFS_1 [[Actinomadura] parvosata subsp. kistnae]|uniref:MFS transporter n=1 Tax=[Actinomadura] parvosata subsp. kistnae TaxID=1909395 RepID=A0A1V0AFS0_9ACTN|nr:MFS transporter [Nonomuraea sp. ATCC 55076]AQZ69084.1 MFS transporter [Nonomuraea sp. ATCC 55076]SPL92336.1 major facilitator superfamily MFS_1 [Actinomadura parvosata subsp. kistnae]
MTRELRSARYGAVLTFVLAGLMVGTMTVRIPALTDKLGLSEAMVGTILLVWGLGALVTMQSMRRVMARLGSRTLLRAGGPLTALGLLGVALAPDLPLLMVAVALFGMAFGTVDVAMNAQGSAVEQAYGRPLMNGMHAGWCVGAISAGGLGSLAIAVGLPFTANVALVALVSLPVMVLLGRTYLQERPAAETARKGRKRMPPIVYLLGTIMFFAFMVEGTVADWNGLYMRDELGAPEAVAALGYPVFEVGMLIARLTGDRLRVRFGVRGMLTVSGVATAGFFAVVLLAPAALVAVSAMFFVGLGVATISPLTLSLAGTATDAPGPAIAQAGAMGYAGLLLGPVVIGFLSDATSLRTALGIGVVLGVLIALAGRLLPRREPAELTSLPAREAVEAAA